MYKNHMHVDKLNCDFKKFKSLIDFSYKVYGYTGFRTQIGFTGECKVVPYMGKKNCFVLIDINTLLNYLNLVFFFCFCFCYYISWFVFISTNTLLQIDS